MAVVAYPAYRQCAGSNRVEVTQVLSDVSSSGMIRGRVMYAAPTYELTLVHEALDRATFDAWESFWNSNFNNEFDITWAGDGKVYRGVPRSTPAVTVIPADLWTVELVFLVKYQSG